jgi:tRNA pseudouridine55 synthase
MLGPKIKSSVHGWLILDKPLGLTSTQAIGKARRLLGGKKVGHGGTLDPLATGILPLAFGEATKLIPYVMDGDKVYEFTIRWGEQRATDDAEGDVTATSATRPAEEDIRRALPAFVGTIAQTPPAFSAIKLGGARAYDIARAGGTPDLAPREVEIYELELLSLPDADRAVFRAACGKGMYVRSLARDLAVTLGTYGYVSALRRAAVGTFGLDRAVSLAKLEELQKQGAANSALLPLQAVLGDLPILALTAAEAQRLRAGQGVLIRPERLDLIDCGMIFTEYQGVPVALVEPKAGEFRVVRGFHF